MREPLTACQEQRMAELEAANAIHEAQIAVLRGQMQEVLALLSRERKERIAADVSNAMRTGGPRV